MLERRMDAVVDIRCRPGFACQLKANLNAPGRHYDIIRQKRRHLGVGIQIDLLDSSAALLLRHR